jgi:hypothetical protein
VDSTVFAPAMRPTPAFLTGWAFALEGGRLAATQRPAGGELCLDEGRISLSKRVFPQVKDRSVSSAVAMAVAGTYTFRSGSNALGGTG